MWKSCPTTHSDVCWFLVGVRFLLCRAAAHAVHSPEHFDGPLLHRAATALTSSWAFRGAEASPAGSSPRAVPLPSRRLCCLPATDPRADRGSRLQRGWRGPTLLPTRALATQTAMARVRLSSPPCPRPSFELRPTTTRVIVACSLHSCTPCSPDLTAGSAQRPRERPRSHGHDRARLRRHAPARRCQASKEVVACAFASCVHAARHRKRTTDDAASRRAGPALRWSVDRA